MWNPPLIDEALGPRRSSLGEAAELVARLVPRGARTICFVKSRKGVELLARLVGAGRRRAARARHALPRRLHGAAAARGRGPAMRGELLAVVTTDALELGIDVGALDAAVVVTFPGTIATLRQMWGRAGRRAARARGLRRGRGRARPVLRRHTDEFLDRPVESATASPERSRSSTSRAASCSAAPRRRGRTRRSTRARSTCTSGVPTSAREPRLDRAARSSSPSTATGTRSRGARPTP